MDYDLSKLKLLTQGGEADLYELSDDKILRVLRRPNVREDCVKELYDLLEKHSVNIPQIYEYGIVDGMQAEVMERICGTDMMDLMTRKPISMKKHARAFAKLHQQILNIEEPCSIPSMEDRFRWGLEEINCFEPEIKNFVKTIFESLPTGKAICHSDFHPGNILMKQDIPYMIDLAHTYKGNRLSDIAHSYVLMAKMPDPPGRSAIAKVVIHLFGHKLADKYLNEMHHAYEFDWKEFAKWTLVMAFMRSEYGLPTEKPIRVQYVNLCYEDYKQGKDIRLWIKKI